MPKDSPTPVEGAFAAADPSPADVLASDLEAFRRDGFIVVDDFLPAEKVSALKAAFDDALGRKMRAFGIRPVDAPDELMRDNAGVLNDFTPKGGNHDLNRWNMHLPSALPFLDEGLFAHSRILSVVKALMGPDVVCYLVASDTPLPGAGFQGAHQDFSRFSIALNVPLIDVGPENGPLEIWPGTHRPPGEDGFGAAPFFLPADDVRAIVAGRPSRRLTVPAGTAILRDHRLVHRGTANSSDIPRPMLSVYYVPAHAPVPFRRFADLAARGALALRRAGRGRGDVGRPAVLNLGNLLGRVVEERSLSDRDWRRVIPAELWDGLSPQARHLLRFASVEPGARHPRPRTGSVAGSARLAATWAAAGRELVAAAVSGRPRSPDEHSR